jgi:hypothetical protein
VLGHPGKPEHPARDHCRADEDQRPRADPRHQLRGQRGGDHDPDGEGQVGDARPDRAVAQDGLNEEGKEEEQAEKTGGDAQHDQVGTRPVTVGEYPHRKQNPHMAMPRRALLGRPGARVRGDPPTARSPVAASSEPLGGAIQSPLARPPVSRLPRRLLPDNFGCRHRGLGLQFSRGVQNVPATFNPSVSTIHHPHLNVTVPAYHKHKTQCSRRERHYGSNIETTLNNPNISIVSRYPDRHFQDHQSRCALFLCRQ